MATLQVLKKKLRSIRSIAKITKAMKTASSVKYSKLNVIYNNYSLYAKQYKSLCDEYSSCFGEVFPVKDESAPVCYIVMSSNKGMCGSFNNDIFSFATNELEQCENYFLILCGKQAQNFFERKKYNISKSYVFSDIPTFDEGCVLFNEIISLRKEGVISSVKIVYPKFKNMMIQTVTCEDLFKIEKSEEAAEDIYFLPDRETLINEMSYKSYNAFFYEYLLETALGAQSATVLTMRSAFDTATQYCAVLEGEINRKRQSQVTADVIETSVEQKD